MMCCKHTQLHTSTHNIPDISWGNQRVRPTMTDSQAQIKHDHQIVYPYMITNSTVYRVFFPLCLLSSPRRCYCKKSENQPAHSTQSSFRTSFERVSLYK